MEKKKNDKKPRASLIQKVSTGSVTMISINLNRILWIIGIIAVIAIAMAFLYRPEAGNEVAINDFVNHLKNNQYSIVQLQDDGKAVAQNKTFLGSKTQTDKELSGRADTTFVKEADMKTATLTDLYEVIKPLTLGDTLRLITKPEANPRVVELFFGENFIIGRAALGGNKDLIINNANYADFSQLLTQKGINVEDLQLTIHKFGSELGTIDAGEFQANFDGGKFKKVWQLAGTTVGILKDENVKSEYVYWSSVHSTVDSFSQFLQSEGVSFKAENVNIAYVRTIQIPWGDLLVTGLLGGLVILAIFMFRGVQGSGSGLMKFGQSKARVFFGRKPEVTFKDVAGIDEAKEELQEIVMFLKEPKKFLEVGARIPKGVLMVGAPGTGKTLLARAIAGEAGVPFFHTSGSEFEEMLVGAGASRVRDLFEKAKKAAPSLIFIDEIDAVARKRGTTIQSSTTEQTLNQILVEMDGFEKNTNVIIIAATNRPDVLDPAILRPGRFDRRVVLDLPDLEGRKQIIGLYVKNKPVAASVDIHTVAKRTVGLSGADIENMLNEAAIIIAREGRKEITYNDIEEAANKVQMGPMKRRKRGDKELKMTAYHEAGHAIVMKLTPEHDPVHRVTIISRGMALGYTMPLAESDQVQMSKTQMLSRIKSLLAGFATEEMIFNDVTSGASNDIEKASNLARRMVKSFGMSKRLGLVKYGDQDETSIGYGYGEQKDYSEESSKMIDDEVRQIINDCFEETKKILAANRERLEKIVAALLEKEVLDAEEFNKFFE